MIIKDLESLKYSELQKLAKGAGIKANQKIDKLIKALKEHYIDSEDDQEKSGQNCPSTEVSTSKTGQSINGLPRPKSREGTRHATSQGTQKFSASGRIKLPLTHVTARSQVFSPLRKISASHAESRKATPSTPVSSVKNEAIPTPSKESTHTPDNVGTRKRRRTFELTEPTLSAQSTPSLDDEADKRATRQRTSQTETGSNEPAKKRMRKNTYNKDSPQQSDSKTEEAGIATGSPGTKALIQEIDINLSSAERKKKLLSALDRKIKNRAQVSPSQNTATQASQIPRFMAFLANKKTDNQKPVTPGNKDWTRIHKKEFSKFDSLDVYLEKKQQRIDKLTGSAKRPARLLDRKGPKVAKPVIKLPAPVKPFVPTVTSTKNINFNFNQSALIQNNKTPSIQKSDNVLATQTPKNIGPVASAKKSVLGVGRTTPYIFTGNNTQNTSVSSHKKTFDLKASLAKPLTWKPHTGKLQSMDFNKPQPGPNVTYLAAKPKVERLSRQAMATKTRPICAKDVRRTKQLDRRNNQKYVDMMKRRGLLA